MTKRILISIKKRRIMFKSHFLNGDADEKSFFKNAPTNSRKSKPYSKNYILLQKLKKTKITPAKCGMQYARPFPLLQIILLLHRNH